MTNTFTSSLPQASSLPADDISEAFADLRPIDLDLEELKALASIKAAVNTEKADIDKATLTHVEIFAPKFSHLTNANHTPLVISEPSAGNPNVSDMPLMGEPTSIQLMRVAKKPTITNDISTNSNISEEVDNSLSFNQISNLNHSDLPHAPKPSSLIDSDDIPIVVTSELEEPLTTGRRLMDMVLVGLIFAVIGGSIDWIINIAKAVMGVTSESIWFFVYFMGILGLVLGWLMGTKALDVVFGLFRTTPTENNPSNDDDSFSSGIMKAIGFGLLIGVMGWFLMMILV